MTTSALFDTMNNDKSEDFSGLTNNHYWTYCQSHQSQAWFCIFMRPGYLGFGRHYPQIGCNVSDNTNGVIIYLGSYLIVLVYAL
jgi:hypothetical protein